MTSRRQPCRCHGAPVACHIRIGSFQRLRYLDDAEGIEMLRHAARHHFAGDLDADAAVEDLAPRLLAQVAARIADTAGSWLAAGFVHGVLNTDNFNITGESFDYGPGASSPTLTRNLLPPILIMPGAMPLAVRLRQACGRSAGSPTA